MKTIGIIAEFNPFHNGHAYLISEAKRLSGADCCVVVMSGDFVQRGEPAVCDKYLRTEMALSCGADAVFELPVRYARASAEQFALGGVGCLSRLNRIDEIYFGSESGDIEILSRIAEILDEEPECYRSVLTDKLKEGLSFPAAREQAVIEYLSDGPENQDHSRLTGFVRDGLLSSPNNILAVEYCRAVLRLRRAGIKTPALRTVKRISSSYDSDRPEANDASALALRTILARGDFSPLETYVPSATYATLKENHLHTFPIFADDFSSVLYSRISALRDSKEKLSEAICGEVIPNDMLNSILRNSLEPVSFTGLIRSVKTKNYTYSAISRALVTILLDAFLPPVHIDAPADCDPAFPYMRLLGIRKDSSQLIRKLEESALCPIINKLADHRSDSSMLGLDVASARLYNQIVYQKFGTLLPDEYRKTIVIV